MTESEPMISLLDAFAEVSMTRGQASSLLQWMGQQLEGTEAGTALKEGGVIVAAPPPVARGSSSSSSGSTGSSSTSKKD